MFVGFTSSQSSCGGFSRWRLTEKIMCNLIEEGMNFVKNNATSASLPQGLICSNMNYIRNQSNHLCSVHLMTTFYVLSVIFQFVGAEEHVYACVLLFTEVNRGMRPQVYHLYQDLDLVGEKLYVQPVCYKKEKSCCTC